MKAKPGIFYTAAPRECARAESVNGFVYKSLGLHRQEKNFWIVTHIWTGFIVTEIQATKKRAIVLFEELANLGDWSFLSPSGWKNCDPKLRCKVRLWRSRYPETSFFVGRDPNDPFSLLENQTAALVAGLMRDIDDEG